MLLVEYLVLVDKTEIKCKDENSFNHLLQSDPEISINKSDLIFRDITVNYVVKAGTVKNTNQPYFHLKFNYSKKDKIETFIDLQRAVKSQLNIVCSSPQTLYDGVSLYYGNLGYPIIFEVENLMRKLITKFMMINVGIDWKEDRLPDDVRSSINSANKDLTYLHNVDFIQLKNYLFSEKYPTHKETLITKLKSAKNIKELDLEEIKKLIPQSNWDRYFAESVEIDKAQLMKKWDTIYGLRCKIAHNRIFNKADYNNVEQLCTEVSALLIKAISKLDSIDIPEAESKEVTETVVSSFSHIYGEFIYHWGALEKLTRDLFEKYILSSKPELIKDKNNFRVVIITLLQSNIISQFSFEESLRYFNRRNRIVHNDESITPDEIAATLDGLRQLVIKVKEESSNS